MLTRDPVIEFQGVIKSYGGLRPLRLRDLVMEQGAIVSLAGFDAAQAEVLVDLVTGATLPDEGTVAIFGEPTRTIDIPDRWLATLDRIGIAGVRVVLVDGLTVAQNIAVPMTLDLDPLPDAVRDAVRRHATDAGLDAAGLDGLMGAVPAIVRVRVQLARALALNPALLLLAHATATLQPDQARTIGADVARLARDRQLTVMAVTGDPAFAAALGGRRMSWQGATGDVVEEGRWARWF